MGAKKWWEDLLSSAILITRKLLITHLFKRPKEGGWNWKKTTMPVLVITLEILDELNGMKFWMLVFKVLKREVGIRRRPQSSFWS